VPLALAIAVLQMAVRTPYSVKFEPGSACSASPIEATLRPACDEVAWTQAEILAHAATDAGRVIDCQSRAGQKAGKFAHSRRL